MTPVCTNQSVSKWWLVKYITPKVPSNISMCFIERLIFHFCVTISLACRFQNCFQIFGWIENFLKIDIKNKHNFDSLKTKKIFLLLYKIWIRQLYSNCQNKKYYLVEYLYLCWANFYVWYSLYSMKREPLCEGTLNANPIQHRQPRI